MAALIAAREKSSACKPNFSTRALETSAIASPGGGSLGCRKFHYFFNWAARRSMKVSFRGFRPQRAPCLSRRRKHQIQGSSHISSVLGGESIANSALNKGNTFEYSSGCNGCRIPVLNGSQAMGRDRWPKTKGPWQTRQRRVVSFEALALAGGNGDARWL